MAKLIVSGLLIGSCCLFGLISHGADRYIVYEGEPRAQIVIGEAPERLVALAAQELQEYILRMSGAKLPIVTAVEDSHPLSIFVGQSAAVARLGVSPEGLDHGAFTIVSGDDWLVLLGEDYDFEPIEPWPRDHRDRARVQAEVDELTGEKWGLPAMGYSFRNYHSSLGIWDLDESGSLQAVYQFLRDLGVRWYFPGEVGEIVPERRTIPLPKVNRTVKPDFPFRHLYMLYQHRKPDNLLWRLRLGLNSPEFGGSHGINQVHSRPEIKESNPEYFAIWNGRRTSDKPCLSAEGLFEANVAYARFLFDHYNVQMVNVSPADGYSRPCECELCVGKATPERGPNGLLSDYVWDYVNRVATELYQSHPDRKVSGLAYTTYLLPPEKIESLSPNLVAIFVRWRSHYTDPEVKERELEIRQQWLDALPSREIYIWSEYAHSRPRGWYSRLPVYYPRLIAEDLRWLKGKSKGEYIPVADNWPAWGLEWNALATNHLNAYVTAKLYWDAELDIDDLLNEYYQLFYGPAADGMTAFIEYAEQTWWKVGRGDITLDEVERLLELLEQARDKTEDDVYGQRMEILWEFTEPRLRELYLSLGGEDGIPTLTVYPRDVRHGLPWMVQIDGRLDEMSWVEDPRIPMVDATTGAAAGLETWFQLGTDGEYLYFSAWCEEPDMDSLAISAAGPDNMNVWRDDAVSLVLVADDEFHYHFTFNPAAAYVDQDRTVPGLEGIRWQSDLEAATFKGENFWSVEVRIPLASISENLPSTSAPWRINVGRERPRPGDRQVWMFVPTANQNFHHLDSATTNLVFE